MFRDREYRLAGHRFVVVKDLLPPPLLEQMRVASARVLAEILALPVTSPN